MLLGFLQRRAAAEAKLGMQLERLGDHRQAFTPHELRAKAGQTAFGELREALEQLLGDGAAEQAVADEFQPLVVVGGEAAMRERLLEELGPPEAIAEPAFERRRQARPTGLRRGRRSRYTG